MSAAKRVFRCLQCGEPAYDFGVGEPVVGWVLEFVPEVFGLELLPVAAGFFATVFFFGADFFANSAWASSSCLRASAVAASDAAS